MILPLRMERSPIQIRSYQSDDGPAVLALWLSCGLVRPVNDPRKDMERKLAVNPEMFLVGKIDGNIVACVMAGYEGHRGWINYLAVSPEYRRRGLGRQMMDEAERLLRQRGCPKINLQVRTSNREVIQFYERIGFVTDDVISMGKRLEQDN